MMAIDVQKERTDVGGHSDGLGHQPRANAQILCTRTASFSRYVYRNLTSVGAAATVYSGRQFSVLMDNPS